MKEYEFGLLSTANGIKLIRRRGKYSSIEHAYADLEANGYRVIYIKEFQADATE